MSNLFLGVVVASAFARLLLYQLADRFRPASPARARATLARWCRWALPWLGVQVETEGESHGEAVGQLCHTRFIYVANHRTYLDILVLAAFLDAAFLSRADISSWPVVGATARLIGAVFVERDSAHGRARAVRQLLRRLDTGSVVVFPEGTTSGGRLPTAFQPGLFRLAQRLQISLIPVTLRYSDRRAYWVEDLSLWRHLKSASKGARLRVSMHIGAPLSAADYADAEELRAAVYAAVCKPIELHGELA